MLPHEEANQPPADIFGLHGSKSSCGNSYRMFVPKYFMMLGTKLCLSDNIFNHKKMSRFAVNNSKQNL